MNKTEEESLSQKLYCSPAVNSLKLETSVYDSFKKLSWSVQHSPYYLDNESKKFREVDVIARKLWHSSKEINLTVDFHFIVECKSIKDYHIVVSNRQEYEHSNSFREAWIGQDSYAHYPLTTQLLKKNEVSADKMHWIIEQLNEFCFPGSSFLFSKYQVDPFEIPVYNSFRETNIGNTKELENSVVWKSFLSLYSCIHKFEEFIWDGIDYSIHRIDRKDIVTEENKAEELLKMLLIKARDMNYIQPLLVVESHLWQVADNGVSELKYLRLLFQKLFEDEMWIDIVNKDYLDEYLEKTLQYDLALERHNFRCFNKH